MTLNASVARLAIAQALSGANSTVVYATGAIIGNMLSPRPELATLPISLFVVGMALSTLPVGMLARRFGRPAAFLAGNACGVLVGLLAALALVNRSFALFCFAMLFGGAYAAVVLTFRFAATECVGPEERPRALSLVLAGGVAAGVVGPQLVSATMNPVAAPRVCRDLPRLRRGRGPGGGCAARRPVPGAYRGAARRQWPARARDPAAAAVAGCHAVRRGQLHIQMIAIGGAIGTGLFYGSSWAIKTAGPAFILTYLVAAVAIYFVMRALGEMAVEEPVSGSYISYSNRYIHRFAGFLNGWDPVIFLLATSAAELNALGNYVHFWFPAFLGTVNRRNVPSRAIMLVFATMFAGVLLNYLMPEKAFELFSSITVFALVCAWTSIVVSHLCFRKIRMQTGHVDSLSYKMPFFPYGNYIALAFITAVLVCIAILPDMRMSLIVSAAWVAIVFVAYKFYTREAQPSLADMPHADPRLP